MIFFRKRYVLSICCIICIGFAEIVLVSCNKGAVDAIPPLKNTILKLEESSEEIRNIEKFTDYELIPLDNAREALIGNFRKLVVTDSLFYIYDSNTIPKVLSFYHDGTFNCQIGETGHKRSEYINISNFSVNNKGDTVVFMEYGNLKFFNSKGNFLYGKTIDDGNLWDNILYFKNSLIMASHYRGIDHLLAIYDVNSFNCKNLIPTDSASISSPPYSQNQIQQVGDSICFFDFFSSSFYVFNINELEKMERFQLYSDNIVNEERARKYDLLKEKFDEVESFVFTGDRIVGHMYKRNIPFDFEIVLSKGTVDLYKSRDINCSFACYYNGEYYKVVSSSWIMDMYEWGILKRPGINQCVESIIARVSEKDNYYILKMKRKM